MADIGIGQLDTLTGEYRSKKLKDAVSDSHPLFKAMEKEGGIRRISGGKTILDESLTGQNGSVSWVGPSGTVTMNDYKVADSPEFVWKYLLGSLVYTRAEQLQNSGSGKYIDLVTAKRSALEGSQMNVFHAGMLSAGTGSGGLEIGGLGALVSTTPTASATIGSIDQSNANAAWFRNLAFNTGSSWADGAVDAGNALRFLDKLINGTMLNGIVQQQFGLAGQTHYEFISAAVGAKQTIVNVSDTGKAGFDKIVYRGIPIYMANGINFSGQTAATLTRTYLLNVKDGGVNLVFHKDAEFDMLDPVNANDQAAISRLMFTMANMTVGAFRKRCAVGFD
jgi:hypothetical protein